MRRFGRSGGARCRRPIRSAEWVSVMQALDGCDFDFLAGAAAGLIQS